MSHLFSGHLLGPGGYLNRSPGACPPNVRAEFRNVRGDLKLSDADITQSEIDIEIDTSSIHTRDEQRDAHLRSPDFFDTDRHPLLTFRSTGVLVGGEITVDLDVQFVKSKA